MNRFRGTIKEVEPCDDSVRVALEVNRSLLFVEMSHNRWEESGLSAGENVHGLLRMNVLEVA
jgi:ABC-type molybdate transport system ATPase subunit